MSSDAQGKSGGVDPTQPPALLDGRYELGPVIGHGGMGDVFAGVDVRLHRSVAVKLLRGALAEDENLRARFIAEARAAARLAHPNVIAIFDTGGEGAIPFIVMERLPGTTVADELAAGAMEQGRACQVATQVLSALDAAHRAGIIHRDIKPANVLLTVSSDIKVADFGIAKVAESADITMTGALLGTPSYLAPERLAGRPATAESDIYSVGVLLYELLAGRKPFESETPLAVLHAIAHETPPPLREVRPDLPGPLYAAVERAMAKDPAERYRSASDMMLALRGETVPPSTPVPEETLPSAGVPEATRAAGHTQVLRIPEDRRPPVWDWRRSATWARDNVRQAALVIGLVVVVAVALVTVATRHTTRANTPAPATTGSSVPAPLGDALDNLDKAVQP